ncbi:MAG TPA: RbsD/FucU domain-containing protein [Terriglobales bacterium]|nr:RbsD/FucU domain-containing protein [Terriglobales bacterium]
MKMTNSVLTALCTVIVLGCSAFAQDTGHSSSIGWQQLVQSRIRLYGHRNWIIVADAAFPVYAASGVETILVNDDLPTVLHYVTRAISSSHHVRATVFLDQELQFVTDRDYPGAAELRRQINSTFTEGQVSSIPHAEVLSRIDEAGKTFRILFIKTTATIPYTSVYMRLDCGYMSDEVDRKIKAAVSTAGREQLK